MPWNNQGNNNGGPWGGGNNGGNNGGNPWGGGPQRPSGGRPNPPDFDKVINDLKNNFGGKMPGGGNAPSLKNLWM
ncbi:MAG: protease modulator HflK N-terminal domain-containing protein, partial [Candidatus Puniceispirillaceae bacterium]